MSSKIWTPAFEQLTISRKKLWIWWMVNIAIKLYWLDCVVGWVTKVRKGRVHPMRICVKPPQSLLMKMQAYCYKIWTLFVDLVILEYSFKTFNFYLLLKLIWALHFLVFAWFLRKLTIVCVGRGDFYIGGPKFWKYFSTGLKD